MTTETGSRRRFGIIEEVNVAGAPGGCLDGKTFVVKDFIDVAGHVTGAGNPDWCKKEQPASEMAWAVQSILDSGGRLTGKSATDEFACSLDGINKFYGTPENPQLPGRIPGGSSSGSGAATGAGLCDFALGTDTLGSVRVPASYCGIFGFRPSHGVVSLEGVLPLGPTFDTLGWMSRSADTLKVVGEVLLSGTISNGHGLTSMKILRSAFEDTDQDVKKQLHDAAEKIALDFDDLKFVDIGPRSLSLWISLFSTIRAFEAWSRFGPWIEEAQPIVSPTPLERITEGKSVSNEDALLARAMKAASSDFVGELLGPGSVLCFPTTWGLPPGADASPQVLDVNRRKNVERTIVSSISGFPEVTIPIEVQPGVSVGLSLMGPRGTDRLLLDLAVKIERVGITAGTSR